MPPYSGPPPPYAYHPYGPAPMYPYPPYSVAYPVGPPGPPPHGYVPRQLPPWTEKSPTHFSPGDQHREDHTESKFNYPPEDPRNERDRERERERDRDRDRDWERERERDREREGRPDALLPPDDKKEGRRDSWASSDDGRRELRQDTHRRDSTSSLEEGDGKREGRRDGGAEIERARKRSREETYDSSRRQSTFRGSSDFQESMTTWDQTRERHSEFQRNSGSFQIRSSQDRDIQGEEKIQNPLSHSHNSNVSMQHGLGASSSISTFPHPPISTSVSSNTSTNTNISTSTSTSTNTATTISTSGGTSTATPPSLGSSGSIASPLSTPTKASTQHNFTLSLLGVRGATKKTEELVSGLNKYWTNLDQGRNTLTKMRKERIILDKQENAIEFEMMKAEYKLEQANRRLGVVVADFYETDNQIRSLSEEGVFPSSVWQMDGSQKF